MSILLYLDPGTGTMILQAVLSAVFAALFFFKSFFLRVTHSVTSFFSSSKKNETGQASTPSTSSTSTTPVKAGPTETH